MTAAGVSVIIVSRHRAAALRLCLLALTQQDHPAFEVVVVADPAGLAAVAGMQIKSVGFDLPNISAARNAGLAQASGEVVAFIDDDAVAEPSWLSRLVAPFSDPEVMASTGFVRGRNGIARQWGAAWVDRSGADHPFDLPDRGGVFDAETDRAIKTQGTNCAFRRDALLAVGGFDPAYHFYHDETDVNLRMAARTAVVPLAQVVHGFAESERRRADRVPASLVEIAASCAVFVRRHSPGADPEPLRQALRQAQLDRLSGHARAGRIGTPDLWALMQGFDHGWTEGTKRRLGPLAPLPPGGAAFLPLPGTGPRPGKVLSARLWQRPRRREQAAQAVASGQIVTLFCLSLSARPHWLRFTPQGYWLQTGGIFGRSLRDGPLFRLATLRQRVATESARYAAFRPVLPLEAGNRPRP